MLTAILLFNLLLSALCWCGVWQVWRWRCTLIDITKALTVAEQHVHQVLQTAPEAIQQTQDNTQQLRQQYQQFFLRLQQAQQLITLMGLAQVWRRRQRAGSQNARNQNARNQNARGHDLEKRLSKQNRQR